MSNDLIHWLRLSRIPGIGPVNFHRLLETYDTAEAACEALSRTHYAPSIPAVDDLNLEIDHASDLGIRFLPANHPDYPGMLKMIDPPPPVISVWGGIDLSAKPCVAIIGSRNASAIGQRFARQLASELGAAGLTIVSGLARGIDTAAHHGSLETGTIAVLGGGVDHIYPRQNADLYEAIKETGALISESPLGYRATAKDFPRRNRIISGLSLGVIVVEAAERSGTLITARYALEQNREVMAAPGSPLDPRTKGCNRLIREGAHLIENAQDVLDVVSRLNAIKRVQSRSPEPRLTPANPASQSRAREQLLSLLSPTPTPKDELIRLSGLSASDANAALLELELSGDVIVEPDGRLSRS